MFSRCFSGAEFEDTVVFLREKVGFMLIANAGLGGRASGAGSRVKDDGGAGEFRGLKSNVTEDAGAGEYGGVGSMLAVGGVSAGFSAGCGGIGYLAAADAGDCGGGRDVGSQLTVDTRLEGDVEAHLRFFDGIGGGHIFVDAVFFLFASWARWWA